MSRMDDGNLEVGPTTGGRPESCHELVAIVRAFFRDREIRQSEQTDAWAILTALRGPDAWDENLKEATTAVVRDAVFGRGSAGEPFGRNRMGCLVDRDSPESLEVRRRLEGAIVGKPVPAGFSSHFAHHARSAFRALRLSWDDSVNP